MDSTTGGARLTGRTALVTGAGSGIGRAIATRFVREGATVWFTDLDPAAAERAAREAGTGTALGMDVTDEDAVAAAFTHVAERSGPVDVVVASAGIQLFGRDARVADVDLATWEQTVRVNLTGAFLTVRGAVRAMAGRGGSIVLIGSPTAVNGEGADFAAYSSSKAGMHGLGRSVAAAYAAEGIRVNTVVPGYTETPLVATIAGDAEARRAIVGRTPLGRAGTPADVEGIAVFLASDESSFATGSLFRVDGGMTSL